jgi:hypothetical protein
MAADYDFGAGTILAAITGLTFAEWEVQSSSQNAMKDFAQVILNDGDVEEETSYNPRDEFSFEFVCNTSPLAAFNVVLGQEYLAAAPKFVLTACSLIQRAGDFSTLTLTGHKHTGTKTHLARKYTVAMPQGGFGVLASKAISGTIPAAIMSLAFSASVDHVDKLDKTGVFLIGASTRCRLEEAIEMADDDQNPSYNAGWETDADEIREANTGYEIRSIRLHKYQGEDTP